MGQVTHVLLTRSPLVYSRKSLTARLACVKHAASVRPEPGSNSPLKISHTQRHGQHLEKLIPDKFDCWTVIVVGIVPAAPRESEPT